MRRQFLFLDMHVAYLVDPFGECLFLNGIALVGDFEDSAISGVKLQNGNGFPLDPRVFT